jgi:phytoene synthase
MHDAFAHCEQLVRAADKDRFLSALFAPAEHRGALFALYAFNVEVSRVREAAREPLAGEIRLQWWRDVLGGEGRGEVAANPVAAALLASMARYRLPPERLEALVEARRFDLYDEPMASLAALDAYGDNLSSNHLALAARVLDAGAGGEIDALAHHAGLAYAVTGLLKAFPIHAARGQLYVPLDVLERHGASRPEVLSGRATPGLRGALAELRLYVRRHLDQAHELMQTASPVITPTLLPVALARPILARMERRDYDPFVPIEIAPWRRQWLIWRAARSPARIFG